MDDLESVPDRVKRAAERGARRVTPTRQLITDAVQVAVER
jgi:hypothetical protein